MIGYLLAGILLLYNAGLYIYRIYFHPLSGFPGPKIAAISRWYEFYFDLVKRPGGQFVFEVRRMHDVYGPIVRIGPDEIHVKDSDWYEILYAGNPTKRSKWPPAAAAVGVPLSTFGTVAHEVHRKRKAAMSNKFSTKQLGTAEYTVKDNVGRLTANLNGFVQSQEVVSAHALCLAFVTDSISHYAFGETMDLQTNSDKAAEWAATMAAIVSLTLPARQFPWLLALARKIPPAIMRPLNPPISRVLQFHKDMRRRAFDFLAHAERSMSPKSRDLPSTVFEAIYNSSALPPSEKEDARLGEEGFLIIGAAAETVARALHTGMFQLIAHPEVVARLREELEGVMGDSHELPPFSVLRALPWLTAIVKETLRTASVITSRLPLFTNEELKYQEWTIPPMTACSLNIEDVLRDPLIWENPYTYNPQRWIDNKDLNRYFVAFSKGTRMCLGVDFAHMELYLAIASIFYRFDFELHDTIQARDIDFTRDAIVGLATKGTKGMRMKVIRDRFST